MKKEERLQHSISIIRQAWINQMRAVMSTSHPEIPPEALNTMLARVSPRLDPVTDHLATEIRTWYFQQME